MMHGRPHAPQPPQGRGLRPAWLAVLVMLAAVLPHLTLLATAAASPAQSHRLQQSTPMMAADTAAPCHEDGSTQSGAAAPPACCITGCAMLAAWAVPPLPARSVGWSHWQPEELLLPAGISRQPARPPPRPEPYFA